MFMSGSVYVFSDKARCLINELRVDSCTQWIDVSVSVGDSLRGNCYAITSDKSHAILDLELSDYSWLIPGKLYGIIKRRVVDERSLPDYGIFMADDSSWMVTQRFKDVWQNAKLVGARFSDCEVSHKPLK